MRAAEDTRAGREHLTKFGHADYAWHQRSVAIVEGTLEHVACVSEGGKIGRVEAANYYRDTDQDTARRFDSMLPLAPCLTGSKLEETVDKGLTALVEEAITAIEGLPKMDVIAETYQHPAAAR